MGDESEQMADQAPTPAAHHQSCRLTKYTASAAHGNHDHITRRTRVHTVVRPFGGVARGSGAGR